MSTPPFIFRQYDIRGRADRDLPDALVTALGRAFCRFIAGGAPEARSPAGEGPTISVGRDCRLSSDRLFEALTRGLMAAGAHVVDIGVGPSPLLYFSAHHLRTDGAIMITGSHNPAQDNGFKMMRGTSTLFGDDIQTLRRLIEADEGTSDGGSLRHQDITEDYIASVAAAAHVPAFGGRVVVDAGNGAAGPLAVQTLQRLGVLVDPMYCEMNGLFPHHHPDPTVEANLQDLRARVLETGAALGVAFDGDGDRIGVIDERGATIWGDRLTLLFGRSLLVERPGAAIIGEVKCSQTLYDDITAKGGRAIVSPTGHSLIKKRMIEESALLAGEMSGHIFFADRYFGFDDAIYAAARLLEIVARAEAPLSTLLADVPEMFATPELRVECPDAIKFEVVEAVREHFATTHEVLDIDGARIRFPDGAWGLCRASNTGPILVLRFEAATEARCDEIRAEVETIVAAARGRLASA
ncbi:MAG: phosphomannomutase/phosphoglucomutase [Myxococcota bacterium]